MLEVRTMIDGDGSVVLIELTLERPFYDLLQLGGENGARIYPGLTG